MSDNTTSKLITVTAFLIGFALIDELTSTEQNALGGFFMLIGQTLSTNSSQYFKRDWQRYTGEGSGQPGSYKNPTSSTTSEDNTTQDDSNLDKDDVLRMLRKTRDIFNSQIDKLK